MTKILTFRRLGLTLFLATILVGPLFQGYFFPFPTLIATAAVSLSFCLWLYGRRKERVATPLAAGWPPRLLLALIGWVALAALWSVYLRGTVDLLLTMISAYLAYLMLQHESGTQTRTWLVRLVSAAALLVAVAGLLEYSGFFMAYPALGDLLHVEPQRSRIYTLFQYPNTAAAFFVATILLQNAALLQLNSRTDKLLLAAVSGIVAVAFVFTLSRGGLIIAPVALILLWAGLPRALFVPSLLRIASAVLVPAALTFYPILRAAPADNWPVVLLCTLVAGAAGAAATWGVEQLGRLPHNARIITAVALVALVTVGGGLAAQRLAGQLPRVFQRVTQIEASDLTNNARFEYLRDALKLTADRPWGYGGGSWLRVYQQVQTVHYVARDPHSHYALIMVEGGVPGLLLLLAAIAAAALAAFRTRNEEPVRWAMAAAAATLAVHAAIDIDLSYHMIWLLLWALFGASQAGAEPLPLRREWRFTFPVAQSLAAAVLLLAGTLTAAAWSYNAAVAAVLRNDNETAIRIGNRAIRLDPLNSEYRTLIPTSENINRALKLDPRNEQLWRFVSSLLEQQGDSAGALVAAKRALQLRPMSVSHYERVADLLAAQMVAALETGELNEAEATAEEIISLGQMVEERGKPSLERQERTFYAYAPLTLTSRLNLAMGQAHLIAGNLAEAEAQLKAALAADETAADAALWLHALYTRTANQEALAQLRPMPSERALNSSLYKALIAF